MVMVANLCEGWSALTTVGTSLCQTSKIKCLSSIAASQYVAHYSTKSWCTFLSNHWWTTGDFVSLPQPQVIVIQEGRWWCHNANSFGWFNWIPIIILSCLHIKVDCIYFDNWESSKQYNTGIYDLILNYVLLLIIWVFHNYGYLMITTTWIFCK